jgi:hypothetical protein
MESLRPSGPWFDRKAAETDFGASLNDPPTIRQGNYNLQQSKL